MNEMTDSELLSDQNLEYLLRTEAISPRMAQAVRSLRESRTQTVDPWQIVREAVESVRGTHVSDHEDSCDWAIREALKDVLAAIEARRKG